MIERLRLVRPSDLYKAIKDGTHSMGVSESKDKQFAEKWVKIIEKLSFKGERLTRDKLTATNVLEWLKVDRPDIASLIINMTSEGMKWLEEDVKQVYDFLFSQSKPQPKPTLTLVKREQPKKEEEPSKAELEQGAEDAGVHGELQHSEQKIEAETSETSEKQ